MIEKLYCIDCGAELIDMGVVGSERFTHVPGSLPLPKFNRDGTRSYSRWFKCPNKRWWSFLKHESFGIKEDFIKQTNAKD